MITLYNVCSSPIQKNPARSFCRKHPYYTAITILIGVMGLTLAFYYKKGGTWAKALTHKWALVGYAYVGVDYLAYTIFLSCIARKAPRLKPVCDSDVAQFLQKIHDGSIGERMVLLPARAFSDNAGCLGNSCVAIRANGQDVPLQQYLESVDWDKVSESFAHCDRNNILSENPVRGYTVADFGPMNDITRFAQFRDTPFNTFIFNKFNKDLIVCAQKTLCTVLAAAAQLRTLPLHNNGQPTHRKATLTREEMENNYKEGATIIERGFFSTSHDPNISILSTMRPVEMTVDFVIYGQTGRNVSSVSAKPKEQEVLFPPCTRFLVERVKAKGDSDTQYQITLYEIVD